MVQAVESPHTLGDLKASKHRVLPVREEMRRNLLATYDRLRPAFAWLADSR